MGKSHSKGLSWHQQLISDHVAAGDAPRQEALKRGERPAREIEDDECLLGEDSDLPTTDNNQGGSEEAAVLTDDDGKRSTSNASAKILLTMDPKTKTCHSPQRIHDLCLAAQS